MRVIKFALLAALLSGGAALAQGPGAAPQVKKLDGRWLVVHRNYLPSPATDPVGKLLTNLGYAVEIRDGKLLARDPGKSDVYLLVTFDPTATPKAVDLKVPDKKDGVLLGIYRLDGDILTLAVGTGKSRPTTFSDPAHQVQLILKRVPKKATAP
jgi:uncharacterized protein (TIGR03067 family)